MKKLNNTVEASKYLKTGLTQGVGGVARRYATMKTYDRVDAKARKTAARLSNRSTSKPAKAKKMTGFGFYIVLIFTILEDILDVALNVTGFLAVITAITSIFISFIIFTYLYLEKINWNGRKIIMWLISVVIETIPFLSILPTYTLVFVLTRVLENNKKALEVVEKAGNSKLLRGKRG